MSNELRQNIHQLLRLTPYQALWLGILTLLTVAGSLSQNQPWYLVLFALIAWPVLLILHRLINLD